MPWSHRKRFVTAVELGEPDLVPITDLEISPVLVEKITGIPMASSPVSRSKDADPWKHLVNDQKAYVKACKKLGFDAIVLQAWRYLVPSTHVLGENKFVDEWGRIMGKSERGLESWCIGGVLETLEDLERWVPPDPYYPGRFETFREVIKSAGDGIPVCGCFNTGFGVTWMVMGGIQKLVQLWFRNRPLAEKFRAKVANASLEWEKLLLDAGVNGFVVADDYCESKGPFISPKLFKEWEVPYLKRAVDTAKKRGALVLKHCDGNAYPIMDYMIEAGIQVFHPMEPGAMDIGDFKKRYGDKVAPMGNVDIREVLPKGSEEDVRRDVRRCIDAAAHGGGYILASSNTIHSGCKLENVFTMVDEARKYGKYPLQKS